MSKPKCSFCESENIIPLKQEENEYICIDCGSVIIVEKTIEKEFHEPERKQKKPAGRH